MNEKTEKDGTGKLQSSAGIAKTGRERKLKETGSDEVG